MEDPLSLGGVYSIRTMKIAPLLCSARIVGSPAAAVAVRAVLA